MPLLSCMYSLHPGDTCDKDIGDDRDPSKNYDKNIGLGDSENRDDNHERQLRHWPMVITPNP